MTKSNIGIIFDCDGTLLDSMAAWHSVDDRLAERAGFDLTDADRDYMTRATLDESAQYIHEHFKLGESGACVRQMILDDMYAFYTTSVKPKAGVEDFLRELSALGIPMTVASSTPKKLLQAGLEFTGLVGYFKAILSVEDLNTSKRKPLIYNTAHEILGTSRESTWGFDDAIYAISALKSAGYPTCGVYDDEIAGSVSALKEAASMFIMSFADISADEFLRLATGVEDERRCETRQN